MPVAGKFVFSVETATDVRVISDDRNDKKDGCNWGFIVDGRFVFVEEDDVNVDVKNVDEGDRCEEKKKIEKKEKKSLRD